MAESTITTRCCIAGGGPAGMMLGFLLARAGVDVVVLEKHADFFRDFRGDTVHPSTLELMSELGLIDAFLKLPHQKVETLTAQVGAERVTMADFRHLPTHCKFVALMPQWDFLNFLAGQARRYPTFELRMEAEATDLVEEGGRIVGVRAKTPEGALMIRADLVVGCDGRHSTVRERAGLEGDDYGAPMDVLWFRMSRKASDSAGHVRPHRSGQAHGHARSRRLLAMRLCHSKRRHRAREGGGPRGFPQARRRNVAVSRRSRRGAEKLGRRQAPQRRRRPAAKWWRPGLICIGDAAHAMSPIGGVGINLAVQDAVAAANRLAEPLRRGVTRDGDLQAIEERRTLPVRFTQWLQLTIQRRIISRVLESETRPKPPALFKLFGVLSGPAPHPGPADRGRHSARARAHAGSGVRRPKRNHARAVGRAR